VSTPLNKTDAQAVARAVTHALDGAPPDVVKRVMDALSAAMGTAERREELRDEAEDDAEKAWHLDMNADHLRDEQLKAITFEGPSTTQKRDRGTRNSDWQTATSEAEAITFGDDPRPRPSATRKGFAWPADMNQDPAIAAILDFIDESDDPAMRRIESILVDIARKVSR
jgi:hypothetical protein